MGLNNRRRERRSSSLTLSPESALITECWRTWHEASVSSSLELTERVYRPAKQLSRRNVLTSGADHVVCPNTGAVQRLRESRPSAANSRNVASHRITRSVEHRLLCHREARTGFSSTPGKEDCRHFHSLQLGRVRETYNWEPAFTEHFLCRRNTVPITLS